MRAGLSSSVLEQVLQHVTCYGPFRHPKMNQSSVDLTHPPALDQSSAFLPMRIGPRFSVFCLGPDQKCYNLESDL